MRKKINYNKVYNSIVEEMNCNNLSYSKAVKKLNISSFVAHRAFEINGGRLNGFTEDDICINKDGILVDKRHNVKINIHNGSHGYYSFTLNRNKILVHRYIATKMISNCENKPQVNHINGNKKDNRIENLEWVSSYENINHAFDNNLNYHGEKSYHSKLLDSQFLFIINSELSNKELSLKFNISQQRVCDLKKGRYSKRNKIC